MRSAAALARTGLVEVRPEAPGQWRLLPSGYVGAVRAGDLQVQVTPKEKVGLDRLLFLLGYARDPGFRLEDVTGIDEPDLWPALAESLARLAERALTGGVLQGYRTVEESLRTIRGRIRIGDQIARRPGLMLPIEVTYDDFTTDIPENQILRTALRRLLAVPRLPAQAAVKLAHLDGRLTGIQLLRPGAPPPAWRPTRLNERYQPALRLAELVLRNMSAEAGPGGVLVAAFVVPMWQVFENFVATALSEALRTIPGPDPNRPAVRLPPGRASARAPSCDHDCSGRRAPRPRGPPPDFRREIQGRGPARPLPQRRSLSNARLLHRLVRTCRMARLRPGQWLTAEHEPIKNTKISIVEYPLDLRASPRDLLRQVDELARRAWNQTNPTLGRIASRKSPACRSPRH